MRLSQVPKMLSVLRDQWAPLAFCVSFKVRFFMKWKNECILYLKITRFVQIISIICSNNVKIIAAGDKFRHSCPESRYGSEQVQDEHCCGQFACNIQRASHYCHKRSKEYYPKAQQWWRFGRADNQTPSTEALKVYLWITDGCNQGPDWIMTSLYRRGLASIPTVFNWYLRIEMETNPCWMWGIILPVVCNDVDTCVNRIDIFFRCLVSRIMERWYQMGHHHLLIIIALRPRQIIVC